MIWVQHIVIAAATYNDVMT